MGNIEKEISKKVRSTKLQKAILAVIATSGMLAVATLAPNALGLLGVYNKATINKRRRSVYSARKRLKEKGLLKYQNGFLELTDKGQRQLDVMEQRNYKIPRPKKWDGHWRVLIFDIEEKRKATRDKLRNTLVTIGFKRLQNSVWVYPYDCEDLITLLKSDFKIGKDLLYIVAAKIEYDKPLRQFFNV